MRSYAYVFLALGAVLACQGAPQARVMGGDDAVPGQVPYQAALSIGGSPNCGAVILSERFAITAMRCVCSQGSNRPWSPQLFTVRAGSVDLYTGGQDITVEEIIVNPDYSDLNNAIVMLKLRKSFVFSELVQPIQLATVNPPVGAEIDVSGWGRLKDEDEKMQRYLQIDEEVVLDAGECSNALGKSVDRSELCLGHVRKHGICRGDFGGPAVYEGRLVGVAAYVAGECGSFLPDVYTSIANNYEWIVQQISA